MNTIISRKLIKKNRIFGSVYDRESFLDILKRERLRTHRNGKPFSLLIFEKREGIADIEFFAELVRIILPRIRETDEVGWYGDFQIGVLLPDTIPCGAKILAEDILKKFINCEDVVCIIRTYPKNEEAGSRAPGKEAFSDDLESCTRGNNEKMQVVFDSREFEETIIPPMPLWKRGLDIFGAVCGLVLASPVFLFITVMIKFVSPGPVFFRQERVGFRKKPFMCLKFRTMKVEADTDVHKDYLSDLINNENKTMIKLDDYDPRIIPFGKILRKSGLDELPQLINILLGDMSLVGPRPCTSYEASEYRVWQHRRFDTKPGLTGLWQVSGKNRTTFVEMMRLDIGYSISKSLLRDLWILIKTFPAVLVQVFDRSPKKKERSYEELCKHRSGWLRILGTKSNSKF